MATAPKKSKPTPPPVEFVGRNGRKAANSSLRARVVGGGKPSTKRGKR